MNDQEKVEQAKASLNDQLANHNLKWLKDGILFLTMHGSRAYGTNTETSDVDIKGICVPSKEYYLGYLKKFEQAEFKEPDGVIFEIRKFFNLAASNNPNCLEILYTDENDWIKVTPLGRKIIDNRDLFLSTKAKFTLTGYAHSQISRINLHYRWLKKPEKKPPTRQQFGLPEKYCIPKDQLFAAMAEIKKKMESWDINWALLDPAEIIEMKERISTMLAESQITSDKLWVIAGRTIGFDDNFIEMLQLESAFKQKMADWDSYQEWKKNRNPKRAELESKFSFDTKHALHLVRLYRMGKELLTTGKIIVKRPDAEELLEIRNGAWSYEYLVEWAKKQEEELNELYKTCKILPRVPDHNKLDQLCSDIVSEFLHL